MSTYGRVKCKLNLRLPLNYLVLELHRFQIVSYTYTHRLMLTLQQYNASLRAILSVL